MGDIMPFDDFPGADAMGEIPGLEDEMEEDPLVDDEDILADDDEDILADDDEDSMFDEEPALDDEDIAEEEPVDDEDIEEIEDEVEEEIEEEEESVKESFKQTKIKRFHDLVAEKKESEFVKGTDTTKMSTKRDVKTDKIVKPEKITNVLSDMGPAGKGEDLKAKNAGSKMPKGSKKESHKKSKTEAPSRVDTRYFKGTGSDKTGATGDGVENFADFTKRI
jgi:hypothetical protein